MLQLIFVMLAECFRFCSLSRSFPEEKISFNFTNGCLLSMEFNCYFAIREKENFAFRGEIKASKKWFDGFQEWAGQCVGDVTDGIDGKKMSLHCYLFRHQRPLYENL